ncbi:MAG: DUF192 domain-containing protein [Halanaeroarchaeum sp.]
MHLRHERDGESRTVARNVDTADSTLAQLRGLMFRRSLPDEYALVFRFDEAEPRDVHMLFVFVPLDVLFLVDGRVTRRERLPPWTGRATDRADTLVELPAGGAAGIEEGDRVTLGDR